MNTFLSRTGIAYIYDLSANSSARANYGQLPFPAPWLTAVSLRFLRPYGISHLRKDMEPLHSPARNPCIAQQLQTVKPSLLLRIRHHVINLHPDRASCQRSTMGKCACATVTAPPTTYRDVIFMNIIKCGHYTLISLNKLYVRLLFEGGYYSTCGYYSSKYGSYIDLLNWLTIIIIVYSCQTQCFSLH